MYSIEYYFHGWVYGRPHDHNAIVYALVEDMNGKTKTIGCFGGELQFLDKPE